MQRVLIDTWWNVNSICHKNIIDFEFIVLIDTWWNVNHKERSIEVSQVEVLIDTWWNVNRI